jgi:hypothetical protein
MLVSMQTTPADITACRGKIVDIIRNNPPLASVPKYFRDGREDYLWYSDFYDDITIEVYHKYKIFQKPAREITPANYTEELAKVDLPYVKELVNLINLGRLCMDYEEKVSKATNEIKTTDKINQAGEESPTEEQPVTPEAEPEPNIKLQSKRKQPLDKFLDQLKEYKYIKETWMSVAEGNKDFISFRTDGNEQRHGSEPHYITMQQFLNNRRRNLREAISGLESIEDMIELLEENRDK